MKKFFQYLKRSRYSIMILTNCFAFFLCMPKKTIETKIIREKIQPVQSSKEDVKVLSKQTLSAGVSNNPIKENLTSDYEFFSVNDIPMLRAGEGLYFKRGDVTLFGRIEWIGKDFFITDSAKVKLVKKEESLNAVSMVGR